MLEAFSRNFHFAAPLRDLLPRTVSKGISPMLSYLHRAAELIFLLYINWAKNRTIIAIERMQVPKRKALYPSINVNGNDNDNSDNLFIHTIQVQGEKKKKTENYRKTKLIEIIQLYVQFLNQYATANVAKLSSWLLFIYN